MNAPDLRAARQFAQEPETNKRIPYEGHVSKTVVATTAGDYVKVIRLEGISFECVDDTQLNAWHEQLNNLWRSIAHPQVALWAHLIRREDSGYVREVFAEGFAGEFERHYADKVNHELLMVNELYLTLVYRPATSAVSRTLFKWVGETDKEARREDRLAALEKLDQLTGEALSSLDRAEAVELGIYEYNGEQFSETYEFFAFLVNHEWNRMPLRRRRAGNYLATTRPFFGYETVEIRQSTETLYGAMLGFGSYPNKTAVGCFDELLAAPFPFVLAQSFTFMTKGSAKWVVKTTRNRMENTDDDAKSQIAELDDLLDDIEANKVVMGHHHMGLCLTAPSLKELEMNIADVRPILGDKGGVSAREDLALEASFWAMLPGNFKYRPRLSPITSRNLSALVAFHNYPSGRKTGNHWGEALTTLVTDANTALHFSIHASDPDEPDGGSKKDVGHALLLGPNGSGKTVVAASIAAWLESFGCTKIYFTRGRDQEIMVRALGGVFLPLKKGVPTGCNIFQLPPTEKNVQFWNEFVRKLVDRPLQLKDTQEIAAAINWLKEKDAPLRRLGRLLDHMNKSDPDGVYWHLRQWCYARDDGEEDGLYAWAFDNETDSVAAVMHCGNLNIGFDTTEFLDDAIIRTPMNMYLFHLVKSLVDGRRLGIFIAEFWKNLADDAFADFAKEELKTIRKENGFVILDSQSVSDALDHPIARTLIEQTATKILFPNPDAVYSEYVEGLSCNEREYLKVKEELRPGARTFLIKQGRHSVVAKLDLKGFDYELDVLSGRKSNILLVERLVTEYGDDPAVWLPIFKRERIKA